MMTSSDDTVRQDQCDHGQDSFFSCFDFRLRTSSFDLSPPHQPASSSSSSSSSSVATSSRRTHRALLSRMLRSWSDTNVKSTPAVTTETAVISPSKSPEKVSSSSASSSPASAPVGDTEKKVDGSSSRRRQPPPCSMPTVSVSKGRHSVRRTVSPSADFRRSVTIDPRRRMIISGGSPSSTARPLRQPLPVHCDGELPPTDYDVTTGNDMRVSVSSHRRYRHRLYGCSSDNEDESRLLRGPELDLMRRTTPADWIGIDVPASNVTSTPSTRKHASFLNEVQVIEFDRRDKVGQVRVAGGQSNLGGRLSAPWTTNSRRGQVHIEPLRASASARR